METELARMASAAQAKFRIAAPNSRPRAVKVIALDPPAERVVKELAQAPWQGATFLHRDGLFRRAAARPAVFQKVFNRRLAQRSGRPHQGSGR